MFAAFWLLLVTIVARGLAAPGPAAAVRARGLRGARGRDAAGPGAGGAARERALDRGGEAGDVIVNLHAQLNMLGGLMLLLIGLSLVALHALGAEWQERRARLHRAPGRHRDRRLLRGGRDVLGGRGASRRSRRVLRLARLARSSRGRRSCSSRRRCSCSPASPPTPCRGLAHDGAPARRRARGDRRRAARLLGHDPEARQAAQPGRARGLRAAARADGLPGRRLALRRLPVHRLDPAAGRAGADVGGDPGRLHPVRERAAAGRRLEGRARLAARDGAALVGPALPRARAPPRPARGPPPRAARRSRTSAATAPGSASRSAGCVAARLDPVRPGARGRRREHRPLLVRAAADARGDRPVREHEARPGQALRLGRPAGHHAGRRAPDPRPDVRSLLVRAAALDAAKAYQLFDLDRGRLGRCSAPRRPLPGSSSSPPRSRCGRAATPSSRRTRGCSAGATSRTCASCRRQRRDGDQLPAARGCPGRAGRAAAARASLLALAFAALLAALVAAPPLRREGALGARLPPLRARRRLRGARAADRLEPGLFRTYYLAGGVLTVAYLGAGSAWLLLPRRARDWLAGGLAVATAAAVVDRGARRRRRRRRSPRPRTGGRRRTARSAGTRSSGRSRSTRSGACS